MAAAARRAIAGGGGRNTEALVRLLPCMSVTASCVAELSAAERRLTTTSPFLSDIFAVLCWTSRY
jgi:hypothetical protein